jgi:hypothetical protein
MSRLILILAVIPLLMGSDCDVRARPVDRQLLMYETSDGTEVEILPNQIPWIVVADDSIEDPRWLDEVLDRMNEWFTPYRVFEGGVDQELFESLWYLDSEDREGYILFWVGSLPDPEWDFEIDETEIGGVANLYMDSYGTIRAADIVINFDYAYHRNTFIRYSVHECGHTLGLDHDDYSLDLGSCMSSPPPYGCRILESDVEYWTDAWMSNG